MARSPDKAYHDSVGFTEGGSPAIYAAMMKSLDDGIGKIMKALDDAQLSIKSLSFLPMITEVKDIQTMAAYKIQNDIMGRRNKSACVCEMAG